jgi:hypothetical protein
LVSIQAKVTVIEVGLADMTGAAIPIPFTNIRVSLSLLKMRRLSGYVVTAVGLKVTVTFLDPPGKMVKFERSVEKTEFVGKILLILNDLHPVLEIVNVLVADPPTSTLPKLKAVGVNVK